MVSCEVRFRNSDQKCFLRDQLKQLSQNAIYWNVTLHCSDGSLALNRLTAGLVFPQLADEDTIFCLDYSVADIDVMINEALEPDDWAPSFAHLDWHFGEKAEQIISINDDVTVDTDSDLVEVDEDPLDQACLPPAPFTPRKLPPAGPCCEDDINHGFSGEEEVFESPRIKIEPEEHCLDYDDDHRLLVNGGDVVVSNVVGGYHNHEPSHTDAEKIVHLVLDSIIDNLETRRQQRRRKIFECAQVLYYSDASEELITEEERNKKLRTSPREENIHKVNTAQKSNSCSAQEGDCCSPINGKYVENTSHVRSAKIKLNKNESSNSALSRHSADSHTNKKSAKENKERIRKIKSAKDLRKSRVSVVKMKLSKSDWAEIRAQKKRERRRKAWAKKKILLQKTGSDAVKKSDLPRNEKGQFLPRGSLTSSSRGSVTSSSRGSLTSSSRDSLTSSRGSLTSSSRGSLTPSSRGLPTSLPPPAKDTLGKVATSSECKIGNNKYHYYTKAFRCMKCPSCLVRDCRRCGNCLDMKRYGGKGTKRQGCKERPPCPNKSRIGWDQERKKKQKQKKKKKKSKKRPEMEKSAAKKAASGEVKWPSKEQPLFGDNH